MRFWKGVISGGVLVLLLHMWMCSMDAWRDVYETRSEYFQSLFMADAPLNDNGTTAPNIHELETVENVHNENSEPSVEGLGLPPANFQGDVDVFTYHDANEERFVQLGMNASMVREQFGDPSRIEPSMLGFEWWIYASEWQQYIQIGVHDDQVVSMYTNAPGWSWEGLTVGMPKSEWKKYRSAKEEVSFRNHLQKFTFHLSTIDVRERPLFHDDYVFAQLFIDIHEDDKIAGMRLFDEQTFLVLRPYSLTYTGSLPSRPDWSGAESAIIHAAKERQVFDLVNVTRQYHDRAPVEWDEAVARVARGHSRDMAEHHYFNHVSPHFGDLAERLHAGDIEFIGAGENIAHNYFDAIGVHHGWLNSADHRVNVLSDAYTHLGVGIAEKYYTQNFIKK